MSFPHSVLGNAIARRWPSETPLIQHPTNKGAARIVTIGYLPRPLAGIGPMRNQTEENIRTALRQAGAIAAVHRPRPLCGLSVALDGAFAAVVRLCSDSRDRPPIGNPAER